MADDKDWWDEEEENYSVMDPELILKPLGTVMSLLSLASCVVMATVMLRSSLRWASWTPYMLLWAAAEALLMLMAVVEGVFIKYTGGYDAPFSGCQVHYFVQHSATFLSTASVMALSLVLLLRGLKPSLFGPCCSLHVALALLVCVLLLYCPVFFIVEPSYQHSLGHMCVVNHLRNSAATERMLHVYLHVSLFLVDVPWPALVCVGLVVLWWKRRQFSEHLRILGAFLLGFLLIGLPKALFDTVLLVSLFHFNEEFELYLHEFLTLHLVVRVCSFVKPLVILGCVSTSSDFRRALKDSFRRPFYWVVRDNPGFTTEMTEVEGDT